MAKGFIYILSNPSVKGKLKIGFSARHPTSRAEELFTTGVISPFEVEAFLEVDNPGKVETEIHRRLADFRVVGDREFFDVDIKSAIAVLKSFHEDGHHFWGRTTTRISPRDAALVTNEKEPFYEWFMNAFFDGQFAACRRTWVTVVASGETVKQDFFERILEYPEFSDNYDVFDQQKAQLLYRLELSALARSELQQFLDQVRSDSLTLGSSNLLYLASRGLEFLPSHRDFFWELIDIVLATTRSTIDLLRISRLYIEYGLLEKAVHVFKFATARRDTSMQDREHIRWLRMVLTMLAALAFLGKIERDVVEELLKPIDRSVIEAGEGAFSILGLFHNTSAQGPSTQQIKEITSDLRKRWLPHYSPLLQELEAL